MIAMTKKRLTDKEKFFIKEYTGRYGNKFMSKKFKVPLRSIYRQQSNQNVNIKNNLAGHEYMTQTQFAKELGLGLEKVIKMRKCGFIKFKRLDLNVLIPISELARVTKFLNDYIDIYSVTRMLNMSGAIIRTKIELGQFESKTMGEKKKYSIIYLNLSEVIEYKNFLSNTYSVMELSDLSFYARSTIRKKIKSGKLKALKDYNNTYRIPKSELETLLKD